MQLRTRRLLAARAAERWQQQYAQRIKLGIPLADGTSAGDVLKRLLALGTNPTPAAVNEVIGNDSWTDLECNECDRKQQSVVMFGDIAVCESCIADALNIVQER